MPRYCGASTRPAASSGSALAQRARQDEGTFEGTDQCDGDVVGQRPGQPASHEVGGTAVQPVPEDRRRCVAQVLDGVGDLGGDAGYGAHVDEPGGGDVLGGLHEHGVERFAEVGVRIDQSGDELAVSGTCVDQRFAGDLRLATSPWTVSIAMRQLRIGWLRRQWPLFGMMAKKPIAQPTVEAWVDAALRDRRIRRDLVKYTRTRFNKPDLVRATGRLADFDGDVLVLWSHNPVMPDGHATGLVELTGGTLRYVDDANVLIMLDQPEQTAREIAAFLTR